MCGFQSARPARPARAGGKGASRRLSCKKRTEGPPAGRAFP
jgi:hypothetical protein